MEIVHQEVKKLNTTPRKLMEELDKHIIGQQDAKKAVSIAVINRLRRMNVPAEMQNFITPKNVMMIGPTGVGKTEIARQIANIIDAPFIKTEATKYTEIGYVGKDVDSIVRDLIDKTVKEIRNKKNREFQNEATEMAREEVLSQLVEDNANDELKSKYRKLLSQGLLDNREVEVEVEVDASSGFNSFEIPGMPGATIGAISISDIMGGKTSNKKKKRLKVKDAVKALTDERLNELIDNDSIVQEALERVEKEGIIFIDEIDKIAISTNSKGGEVSREGVQRDLLPLIEGTTVTTKYGLIKTDHILFICCGAFHSSKPSDLSPEFQGRFPIRVELKPLTKADFIRILTEPVHSLVNQYKALIATEGVDLVFEPSGIEEMAAIADNVNREIENIGARRLHTIIEKVLEEVNFTASEMEINSIVTINKEYVTKSLKTFFKQTQKLEKFIL